MQTINELYQAKYRYEDRFALAEIDNDLNEAARIENILGKLDEAIIAADNYSATLESLDKLIKQI